MPLYLVYTFSLIDDWYSRTAQVVLTAPISNIIMMFYSWRYIHRRKYQGCVWQADRTACPTPSYSTSSKTTPDGKRDTPSYYSGWKHRLFLFNLCYCSYFITLSLMLYVHKQHVNTTMKASVACCRCGWSDLTITTMKNTTTWLNYNWSIQKQTRQPY